MDKGRVVAVDRPGALMEQTGAWAIDRLTDNGMDTRYFKSREDARRYTRDHESGFTLRRVNLEDAFLALTGKKVK